MRKLLIITLALCLTTLGSCKISRFFIYNFADINDHKKFPKRDLAASTQAFHFKEPNASPFNGRLKYNGSLIKLDEFLPKNKSVSFLIIRNDSILYEQYFKGYESNDVVPSFSVAKSFTSALIGCAIDDGYIKSANEPITNYIPELKKNGFEKVTIRHVLLMTSGLDFNESYYNPFGDAATFYYGRNLRKAIAKMKLKEEPGKRFEYQSGNTQLLGLILERSLQGKTITHYLQEKLWTPLRMESAASWSIDKKKDGLEKTFCCINATARDFAKFGRLYMHQGNWNGQQIISKEWIQESTKLDTADGSAKFYQYQWWLPRPGQDFLAIGILGQYIYVDPSKQLIIVRQGSDYGNVNWWNFFIEASKQL